MKELEANGLSLTMFSCHSDPCILYNYARAPSKAQVTHLAQRD